MLHADPESLENKMKDSREFMEAVRKLIQVCGDDPDRQGLQETPFRVMKKFLEYTEGYREEPKAHLEKLFDVDHRDLIMVKDIDFDSVCEHHFAPIFGVAHVGYIPNGKITGLSKIARMVDGYAKRFQVQERLTNQIAEAMEEVLRPQGVMVVIEAKHMCMCGRGVKKRDSVTVSTASRGIFAENPEKRKEFLSLLKN
ncbi:GTP cyclohydrolase I FolE [Virgibacillus halophilus]|uniref:GTP cyclohydrolase 1 n=2 Tax=Tigheibacillus halophilus TaxID=361280 RepID=A0ABU5C797_9BACI|nr:GTP cyclohydrolase I FolE [Virgibacillus halophilus]